MRKRIQKLKNRVPDRLLVHFLRVRLDGLREKFNRITLRRMSLILRLKAWDPFYPRDTMKYAEIKHEIARVNYMDVGEVVKQVIDELQRNELEKAAAVARADNSIANRHFDTCANMEKAYKFFDRRLNKASKWSIEDIMSAIYDMIGTGKKRAKQG